MTEQQIDAEVSRYEPFYHDAVCFAWFLAGACVAEPGDRSDVPADLFARLSVRDSVSSSGTRYYPTREAAFADLRQAIAASGLDTPTDAA